MKTCRFFFFFILSFCLSFFAGSWGESEAAIPLSSYDQSEHVSLLIRVSVLVSLLLRRLNSDAPTPTPQEFSPQVETATHINTDHTSRSVSPPITLIDDFVSTHSPQGGYWSSGSLWYFNIETSIDGVASRRGCYWHWEVRWSNWCVPARVVRQRQMREPL